MLSWLSDLFKSGPVYKHWWRENHDGSFRVVASIYRDGNHVEQRDIAVVTFESCIPLGAQHAAMARLVKGLDNA